MTLGPTIGMISNIGLAAIGMGGAALYLYNLVTLGQISSFILYSRKFSGPINEIANITNELQDFFVNETRLGIPVALQSENLCGYPGAGGTLFPAQINVGATWEPELAEQMKKSTSF